jgi:alkylhydroperoxidase family enzyme
MRSRQGLTEAQIAAFESPESGTFTPAELAVLALGAELALTNSTGVLSEALHGQLAAYFDDAQILELGLVGGILAGVAKFMFTYDLVEKEDSCPFHPVT